MSQFWNDRYRNEAYAYGKEPNAFFKEQIGKLKPGKLFVPGAGEGRDAVYAASLGWDVTALDLSSEGRTKAMQLAAEKDCSIRYEVLDIGSFDLKTPRFDAIALIYFHLPAPLREAIYPKLASALNSGGILILEAFHPSQLRFNSGGPKDISMLISAADTERSFASLEKMISLETEVVLDEGPFHQGPAFVTRFAGYRK